ncbi:MAG: FmdB family transcriptional regulator [Coriobacteriaceae bacterium]|nr:FmdB family transcriptional regulator [Coriobacteriaceae bacterium]
MSSYDFRCTECGEVFEIVRSHSDSSEVCCPSCEAPAKRVFTPVGVVFKGSGFHSTDYRKGDGEKPAEEKQAPCGADKAAGPACPGCPAAE